MKTLSLALVPIALLASTAFGQAAFQINTPTNPVQCVPFQITWTTGGQEPFFLSINNGNANGPAVQQFTGLTGTSYRWAVNIGAGTTLGLTLTDNNGVSAQSAPFTIASGPDSSCLGASGSSSVPESTGTETTTPVSSSGSASGSTPVPTTTATTPASSIPATTSGAASSSRPSSTAPSSGSSSRSGSASSSAASASSTSTGAAKANVAAAGAAGIIGAVVAAIMA